MKTQEALDQIAYLQRLIAQTSPGGSCLLSPLGPALDCGVCGFDLVVPCVWVGVSGRCGHLRHDRLEEKARAAGSIAPQDRLAYAGMFVYIVFLFSQMLLLTTVCESLTPFGLSTSVCSTSWPIFEGRSMLMIGCWLIMAAVAGLWLHLAEHGAAAAVTVNPRSALLRLISQLHEGLFQNLNEIFKPKPVSDRGGPWLRWDGDFLLKKQLGLTDG